MSRYAAEILNLIEGSRSHMTAEGIFLELKKSEPRIVLATVYNNLNALSSRGLIRKISIEGEADRYDRRERHDHIFCRLCGRIADFDFGDLTTELKAKLQSEVFGYDLKAYYECPECRNKKIKGDT